MPKADNARKRVSAGAALDPTWGRQVSELRAREADLRLQSARSAHRFHLAAGRLRSTLSAFRPLLAPGATDTLIDDLKWVAVPAGDARDAESMRERARPVVGSRPPGARHLPGPDDRAS